MIHDTRYAHSILSEGQAATTALERRALPKARRAFPQLKDSCTSSSENNESRQKHRDWEPGAECEFLSMLCLLTLRRNKMSFRSHNLQSAVIERRNPCKWSMYSPDTHRDCRLSFDHTAIIRRFSLRCFHYPILVPFAYMPGTPNGLFSTLLVSSWNSTALRILLNVCSFQVA